MLSKTHNPDILTCLANLSNEEVFKIIQLSEKHSVNELINSCLVKNQKKLFNILTSFIALV